MNIDGAEDLIISVNSAKNLSTISNSTAALSMPGGILCVKAAMLLQVSYSMILSMLLTYLLLDGILSMLFIAECFLLGISR